MSRKRRIMVGLVIAAIAGFLLIQVIPVGSFRAILQRNANPPVLATIEWISAEAQNLARTACYDCHSNETIYPWYAEIAPISWLITRDVNRGRAAMNFSEDAPADYDLEDLKWHLYNNMPPRLYVMLHPEAQLTDAQRDALMQGFQATFTQASNDGMDMNDNS